METAKYQKLSVKMAVGLAAPHTWAASILPVLLGTVLAASHHGAFDFLLFGCVLCISVLMQSAVNALNDYYDFVKGTDTKENSDDPSDAVLVYNNINPKAVLGLGASFLTAAALIGIYVVFRCGIEPLIIGLAGGLVIVLYSAGSHPLSYYPVGEVVSGVVMGGLIPLAVYNVMTGSISMFVLYQSVPVIIGIGMIMFTNNISDIERDILAGRKTFAVLIGRRIATKVYRLMMTFWILCIAHMVFWHFRTGLWLLPVAIGLEFPVLKQAFRLPYTAQSRGPAMGMILKANILSGLLYMLMIAVGTLW